MGKGTFDKVGDWIGKTGGKVKVYQNEKINTLL